jgi:hypothetical protein
MGNVQTQADAAHRLDPGGVAELLPQGGDVDVDRLRAAVPGRLPHLLQDLRARHDGARLAREQRQEVELLRRQVELTAVDACTAPAHVELERPHARAARRRPLARAPRHSADAGQQLAEAERLDDVVVRTQLEADDAVDLLALGRDHDDRHVGAGTELAADGEAVHVGKAEVEQHEVGAGRLQRGATGRGALDVEPFASQPVGERLGDRVLVLDDQDLHVSKARRRPGARNPKKPVPLLRVSAR